MAAITVKSPRRIGGASSTTRLKLRTESLKKTSVNSHTNSTGLSGTVVKPIDQKQTWEKFLTSHPEANFLHSFNWGKFHQVLGKTIYRIGYFKGGTLKGVMLAIVEKAKRATYLTVPGGPIIDWTDKQVVASFCKQIKKIARQEHCSFVRVRPQILETPENSQLFNKLGFRKSPMHLHAELTHQLDLSLPQETLLKNMRKNTRYEINKAQKLNLKITTSQDYQDIENFYKLQLKTARRQKFIPFSYQFLLNQFKVFSADNQVKLYTAKLNHQVLTQAFIIFYGQEADYHYSASSKLNRKYPGSYALLWQAIKDAQKQGFKRFNLWGVAPENQTEHRFYGVSVFKRGFRGKDVHYLQARDLVINRIRYSFNYLIEQIRKKARSLT